MVTNAGPPGTRTCVVLNEWVINWFLQDLMRSSFRARLHDSRCVLNWMYHSSSKWLQQKHWTAHSVPAGGGNVLVNVTSEDTLIMMLPPQASRLHLFSHPDHGSKFGSVATRIIEDRALYKPQKISFRPCRDPPRPAWFTSPHPESRWPFYFNFIFIYTGKPHWVTRTPFKKWPVSDRHHTTTINNNKKQKKTKTKNIVLQKHGYF